MGIWIILIRGPLYSALHVTYPENTYTESVGLPMTIMGNVLVKNPQALSNTTKNFLNTMASDEEWKNNYIPGDYNSIKWLFNTANHISGVPVEDFAAMTLNTVQSDPKNSFLAIRDVTYPVWQPWGEFKSVNIFSNKESLFNETNPFRKLLKESLFAIDIIIISIPLLGEMFAKIGLQMLLLLLVGIIALYKNGSKTLLFIVPMLVYNLGTLLFLCTASDVRFFHFNAVITLPYIVVLLFNPCNTP
ncbi:hypothetical protein FACS189413_12340 [Bacteroidia bacterium]|nr:hypothetical protein FACS189413_12340 [Bacteroidia bacterium]